MNYELLCKEIDELIEIPDYLDDEEDEIRRCNIRNRAIVDCLSIIIKNLELTNPVLAKELKEQYL